MEQLVRHFNHAKKRYDAQKESLDDVRIVAQAALSALAPANARTFGEGPKRYSVLEVDAKSKGGDREQRRSRPFLPALMLTSSDLDSAWKAAAQSIVTDEHRLDLEESLATKLLYTTVMGFALAYDLWKPSSRKTPGTFFEVVLGSLLSRLAPEARRGKHITLKPGIALIDHPLAEIIAEVDASAQEIEGNGQVEGAESASGVSTDIVLEFGEGASQRGVVVPAKITTRERIVQPFAHQRILDSAFGEGRYISLLACVSETQRDDKNVRVNDICVPGTIALFQQYLAKLGGIYYLDPPARYLRLEESGLINVRSVASLVTSDFHRVITQLQTFQPVPL